MIDTMTSYEGALTTMPEFDPALPVYEIWLDGARFASTQLPALAKRTFDTMRDSRRYGLRSLELRVVNDRRAAAR